MKLIRGGFRGGKAGGRSLPPPQGFDPLPTQKVSTLVLFKKSIFGRPTLKERERAKKTRFFVKVPKNGFFYLFFFSKSLAAAQKIWPKQRLFSALVELGKFCRPKKNFSKTFQNFLKIRPTRENPRSAPRANEKTLVIQFYTMSKDSR